ncbi:MAG: DNA mismatch repair endonuclease MutH [Arsenophonus sp.]|nr:MAG: DNA mismatch repair endonuclease MutH [Arsenophonus sp.]
MHFFSKIPNNEEILLKKAHALAGYTIAELASDIGIPIPFNLKNNKGWVGELLEHCLGANAGKKKEKDFLNLGIELKTIPINRYGQPLETTFICTAPLTENIGVRWNSSYLRYKLSRILWIPIEGEKKIPLGKRKITRPILWSPNLIEEKLIKQDWEELMDMIVLGYIENLTGNYGEILQIRPKAANKNILTKGIGKYGQPIMTQPRAFYLKKNFTSQILIKYLNIN